MGNIFNSKTMDTSFLYWDNLVLAWQYDFEIFWVYLCNNSLSIYSKKFLRINEFLTATKNQLNKNTLISINCDRKKIILKIKGFECDLSSLNPRP